jgi:hypothetical protein
VIAYLRYLMSPDRERRIREARLARELALREIARTWK